MKIYIHHQVNELALKDVSETLTVRELAEQLFKESGAEVWLEDEDSALDGDLTLDQAGIKDRGHVHVSKCRRVEVTVRYAGESKVKSFAPSATVARVFQWATGKKAFDLTPTERAKHTLGICGSVTQPDKSEHVGSIAEHGCAVCFDLAPKERFEG